MFRGRSDQTIDAKGRIILPVKFREILVGKYDSSLILTNFDTCLIAYPTEEWVEFEEKIRKLPSGDRKVRTFKRFIISGATECNIDRQGRILIPPSLKTYAQLERDIVVAGQSRKCAEFFSTDPQEILQSSGRLVNLQSRP